MLTCRLWLAVALASASFRASAQEPAAPPASPQSTAAQPPGATAAAPQAPHAPQAAARTPLQWQFGDYTLKFGGYVKVDLIHDFDEIGSTDSFDPRTIPTDDESNPGTANRIHARETRVNLDLRGPTSIGPFRAFVEGDFFSDQNGFRLRHAYGTVGPVLGGQTWSTFMDEDAMPQTLDFESPIAMPLIRQGLIRFTHDFEDGSYAAIAVEDPDSDVLTPAGVAGEVEEPTPDLTGRLRWKNELGHVQLGLFAGTARFDPDAGPADTVFLWGLNLATKITTVDRDNAIVQVTYGDGVGRYRGGITAAPDANGELEPVEVLAFLVGYQHHWSDEFRSNVCYSWGAGDVPAGAPLTTTEELEYLAANLIWQFCDRAWTGIEYLYGGRETADTRQGEAHRVQMSIRFDF